MRTFIAALLDEPVKEHLTRIQGALKEKALRGNYTTRENLHITLKFLGEIAPQKIEGIQQVLDAVCSTAAPIGLTLGKTGYFKQGEELLYWTGIQKGAEELAKLNTVLEEKLHDSLGFKKEKRRFKAHITIARRIILQGAFEYTGSGEEPYEMPLTGLALMESSRPGGKLTYTPLYKATFGKELQV